MYKIEKALMNQDLLEISDGKLYRAQDMARVGCHDCRGCHDCCTGMGDSVILDPMDVHMLCRNLGKGPEELLMGEASLGVEDGLILPHLRMEENCAFLNENGRCKIHDFRPGLCRLFPLGRNYDGDKLNYFILKQECRMSGKSKVRISSWLGVEDYKTYEAFLVSWHGLKKEMAALIRANMQREQDMKELTMFFLKLFYLTPYGEDFYGEYDERKRKIDGILGYL